MAARASKPCSHHGCPHLQPCPNSDHVPAPWATSTRRERTVSGSAQQKRRRRILRQHAGVCHVCGRPDSDQVDHVIPLAEGGTDTDANLRPIHERPCHLEKTQAESHRTRTRVPRSQP